MLYNGFFPSQLPMSKSSFKPSSLLVVLQMNTYWCEHKMKAIQCFSGFPSREYMQLLDYALPLKNSKSLHLESCMLRASVK